MSLGYTNFREIKEYINGLPKTSPSRSGNSDQDACSPVIRDAEGRDKPRFGYASDYNQQGYAVTDVATKEHITYNNASVPSPLAEFWYSSENGKENDQQMLKGYIVDQRSIHPGLAYDRPQNVGMDGTKRPAVNIPSPLVSTNWHYSSSKLAGQDRETESSSAVDLEERHKEGKMIKSSSEDDLEEDTQNEDSSRDGMVMDESNQQIVYEKCENFVDIGLSYEYPKANAAAKYNNLKPLTVAQPFNNEVAHGTAREGFGLLEYAKANASAKYNNLKPLTVAQPPFNNEGVHGTAQKNFCRYHEYPKAKVSAKYNPKGPDVYKYPSAKYDRKPNAQAAVAGPPYAKEKESCGERKQGRFRL